MKKGKKVIKKYKALFWFVLVMISFCISGSTMSAAKKLEKKEPHPLYVQQGKTYKLSKLLSDISDPYEYATIKSSLKGKKVTWSAKRSQIKLTKKTVKVKKQGKFKLIGVTKKYKYVITLVAVPEKWPKIPEGVGSASIMKEGKFVQIKDMDTVNYLCHLFNSADYRFDYKQTNWRTIGWDYAVYFYASDGKLERHFVTVSPYVVEKYWYKMKNPIDIYQRVSEIYDRMIAEQEISVESGKRG